MTLFVTLSFDSSLSFLEPTPEYSCEKVRRRNPSHQHLSTSSFFSSVVLHDCHSTASYSSFLLFFISIAVPRYLPFSAPPSNPAFLGSKLWAFSPEPFLPIYHSISSLSVCLWYSSLGLRLPSLHLPSLPCVYVSKREEVVKHFSSLLIVLTGPIGIPIRPIDFLALSALIFKFLIDPRSKSPAHSLTQSRRSQGQRWRKKDWEARKRGKGERLVLGKYTDRWQRSELTEWEEKRRSRRWRGENRVMSCEGEVGTGWYMREETKGQTTRTDKLF